jgi:hypothetical protein
MKFDKPETIQPPNEPKRDPNYQSRFQMHDDMTFLLPSLGPVRSPESLPDEIVDHLQSEFMFEGFPGMEVAFWKIAQFLVEHGVDPFSSDGQFVLSQMCQSTEDEMFGDVDRWVHCDFCGEPMKTHINLDSVNRHLIDGGWHCEKCVADNA